MNINRQATQLHTYEGIEIQKKQHNPETLKTSKTRKNTHNHSETQETKGNQGCLKTKVAQKPKLHE